MVQAFRPLELGELAALGLSKEFDDTATKYGMTNAQTALSWLSSQQGVVVIATTHDEQHLNENLKAIETKMDTEDIELLRSKFPVKTLEKNWIR